MSIHYEISQSADGWSLHAPGSTEDEIASGDAPVLAAGPWPSDDDHSVPDSGYEAADLAYRYVQRREIRTP